MKSVFSAIIAALKTLASAAASTLSWPLRFLFGGGVSSTREPIPEVAPALEKIPEPPVDPTEMYRKIAIALQTWAAESILAGELLPVPSKWPRSVQEFARGLTREESFALIDAPENAIIGHICGLFSMPGVRKLQPLRPTKWRRQEPIDPCRIHVGFAASTAAAPEPC